MAGLPAAVRAEAGLQVPVFSEHAILEEPGDTGLHLYVLPLRGADCLLLVIDGQTLLVDMGKQKDYSLIREVLQRLNISKVDVAFNSHPHSDHIGGMAQLAEDFPVSRFLTAFPLDFTGPSIFQKLTVARLQALDVPIDRVADGAEFTVGGAVCRVMQNAVGDINAQSALLHITYGDVRLLLAADVDVFAQNRVYRQYGDSLRADVLKYPHHGTGTLDPRFIEAVNPAFAIITHGSGDTLKSQRLLGRRHIPYKFATRGVIALYTDGQGLAVSQELIARVESAAQ